MYKRTLLLAPFALALIWSAQQTRNATLSVRIVDASTGQPMPARVKLVDQDGKRPPVAPEGAVGVMWGRQDRSEGFEFAAGDAFYADGSFRASLPPGKWMLRVSKGFEYLGQEQVVDVEAGRNVKREVRLERWIDMPERGWYSADDHIHLQRSERDDPAVLRWIAGEDLYVGNILQMGDFWATFFTQHEFGSAGRYREADRILSPGQEEPRTPEIGHTISLGAREFVRFRDDYYNYGRVFDRVHELGGISGFAHQATTFHGYRGMVLTALAGKLDFMELVQFCAADGPLVTRYYYQFLNLGIPLTALAGSDYPWCGRGSRYGLKGSSQIGNARFYTYVDGAFSAGKWLAAVKAGHTFATAGPMLELTVNGAMPGDTLEVAPKSRLRIQATALGQTEQVPLESLEVVAHGKVIGRADGSRESLKVDLELPVDHGVWIAARAKAERLRYAHTTPVYIKVAGGGFEDPETVPEELTKAEEYLVEIERELDHPGTKLDNQASRHRESLERQIAAARAKIRSLREKL